MDDSVGCFSFLCLILIGFILGGMFVSSFTYTTAELTFLAIDIIVNQESKEQVIEILNSGNRISYDKNTRKIIPSPIELSIPLYKEWTDSYNATLNSGDN